MIKDTILATILLNDETIVLYKHVDDNDIWFSYYLVNADSSMADDNLSCLLSELAIDIKALLENS